MDDKSIVHYSLKKTFKKLVKFFNDDYEKVFSWLMTANPALENQAPLMMIALGKTDKLCQTVNAFLKGNRS